MAFTPYHFGINGAFSSISPKKIDLWSCILANLLLDIQPALVLYFNAKFEIHGISHTLIFAIPLCALFFYIYGLIVNKYRKHKKNISSYIFGGMLGGFLHILFDSFYHPDVKLFYPFSEFSFYNKFIADNIYTIGYIGFAVFAVMILVNYKFKRYT